MKGMRMPDDESTLIILMYELRLRGSQVAISRWLIFEKPDVKIWSLLTSHSTREPLIPGWLSPSWATEPARGSQILIFLSLPTDASMEPSPFHATSLMLFV